jgi:hypothetical protein
MPILVIRNENRAPTGKGIINIHFEKTGGREAWINAISNTLQTPDSFPVNGNLDLLQRSVHDWVFDSFGGGKTNVVLTGFGSVVKADPELALVLVSIFERADTVALANYACDETFGDPDETGSREHSVLRANIRERSYYFVLN